MLCAPDRVWGRAHCSTRVREDLLDLLGAPSQDVATAVPVGEVGDGNSHQTGLIDAVVLLDPRTLVAPFHGVGAQLLIVHVPQRCVEGEDDVLVGGDLTSGLAGLIDVGAFNESVPADVVGRIVLAGQDRSLTAVGGGLDGLRVENRIEGESVTGVGLTEDPETARETIGEVVSAAAVGSDCQTDGRGGSRVGERWTRRPKRSRTSRGTSGKPDAPPTR